MMSRPSAFCRRVIDDADKDMAFTVAAFASLAFFFLGVALLGSSRLSGVFYLLALLPGLYVLTRLEWRDIAVPAAARLYLALYIGFAILIVVHMIVVPDRPAVLEPVARIGLGFLNGFFFLWLFRFSRTRLFHLLIGVAAAQASIAVVVAFFQAVDPGTLSLTGVRAGGTTNPIPFAGMLVASTGLVAIFLAGRVERGSPWRGLALLGMVLLWGLIGVFLSGTRGALVTYPFLVILLAVELRGRLSRKLSAAFVAAILVAAAGVAGYLFDRDPETWSMTLAFLSGADAASFAPDSTGLRFQLWLHALELFRQAPLFGQGLGTFPSVLDSVRPEVPADSLLHGFNHVHNQLLDVLMELGLVGGVLFFGPMMVVVVAGLRMLGDAQERLRGLAMLWIAGAHAILGLTTVYYAHASSTLLYGIYMGFAVWLAPAGRRAGVQRPEVTT